MTAAGTMEALRDNVSGIPQAPQDCTTRCNNGLNKEHIFFVSDELVIVNDREHRRRSLHSSHIGIKNRRF